jgi:hypothetical protein
MAFDKRVPALIGVEQPIIQAPLAGSLHALPVDGKSDRDN